MGEFILILIVGLIVFGPSKLPEVGRTLGKGLREFRKAQAALSATLNESVVETEKRTSPTAAEKKSPAETPKVSTEKKSVTTDDLINLAKENPIVKEKVNEESFNDDAGSDVIVGNGGSDAASRGSSDSSGK